jgi:2'-hydroxyisoflavone reductase
MRLLLIGGTRFLGRHVVADALERGHRVTLFHRGKTRPGLFPECERILGDREHDLAALGGREWDAVVDTCGFVPRVVGETARRLAGRTGHYTFISSISVYADPVPAGADETAPLATVADPAAEAITGATYGGLKVLSERAADEALPGKVLHVRAGLLVGPWDYTDRFSYWVRRFAEPGSALVPDAPAQLLQWIDARDAAAWIVRCAEAGTVGTFNVTGPREPATLGGVLAEMRSVLGSRTIPVPVAPGFLTEHGVQPWMEMPLWVPDVDGFLSINIRRALDQRLELRPLADTVRDTHDWLEGEGKDAKPSTMLASPPPASLSRERERELLEKWKSR